MRITLSSCALMFVFLGGGNAVIADEFSYPARGQFAFLLYEDQFPLEGDFDFNDAVVAVNVTGTFDVNGITELQYLFEVSAVGAGGVDSGLALHLPVPAGTASQATLYPDGDRAGGMPLRTWANETEAVITVYDDVRDLFDGVDGFINTDPSLPHLDPRRDLVEIRFTEPIPVADLMPGGAPYDLFFFRTHDASHQVHLPQYPGTDQMDGSLFNTGDDASTGDRHFVTSQGIPWLLLVPDQSVWPIEGARVDSVFPSLLQFVQTGAPTDWYRNFDPTLVYNIEPLPGDANGDGWIDGTDYLIWAGNYGTHPGPNGDVSDGDFNDDGWVDGLDYLEWAGNFGSHAPTAVPEPTTMLLAFMGAMTLFSRRPRA